MEERGIYVKTGGSSIANMDDRIIHVKTVEVVVYANIDDRSINGKIAAVTK